MTPKKLSQKFLKRAGELKREKSLLLLDISHDEQNEKILKKMVKSVNS